MHSFASILNPLAALCMRTLDFCICRARTQRQLLKYLERFVELVVRSLCQANRVNLDANVRHHS